MHTFVGLKCLTETKIQILCDHVNHTRFHIVEMGCQMVQLLSAHIVGPTMFVSLTPALRESHAKLQEKPTGSRLNLKVRNQYLLSSRNFN